MRTLHKKIAALTIVCAVMLGTFGNAEARLYNCHSNGRIGGNYAAAWCYDSTGTGTVRIAILGRLVGTNAAKWFYGPWVGRGQTSERALSYSWTIIWYQYVNSA